jgi:hypothetical protein
MNSTASEDTDTYYFYEYVYEGTASPANPSYFSIFNNSQYMGAAEGSPIEITIEAIEEPIVNPGWELFRGSEIIQSDRYLLTIPLGYKLVVSSFPDNQYARLVAPDLTFSNVYQQQDLTKTNFITIPTGASTLVFRISGAKISWTMREERLLV